MMSRENQKDIFWAVVKGKSMRPFLLEKDRLLVRPVPSGEIKVGDIAAIKRGADIIIHRVISKRVVKGEIIIAEKGDHNFRGGKVKEEDILGRAVIRERKGKTTDLNKTFWVFWGRIMAVLGGAVHFLATQKDGRKNG